MIIKEGQRKEVTVILQMRQLWNCNNFEVADIEKKRFKHLCGIKVFLLCPLTLQNKQGNVGNAIAM
jgi:hypothetical protein